MKNMLKLLLPLTAISAVCAAVLAVVDSFTRLPIANIATLKANRAAQAVMPVGVKALVARPDPADTNVVLFVGYADDARTKVLGYAVPGTSPNGYAGDIRLMAGLTADRAVVTYRVLAANETPGLGAKLGDAAFAAQFVGKPAAALKVKKDGGAIDALTGATITSRAVCEALADAVARVDRLEGRASAAVPAAPPPPQEGRLILDPTQSATALKVLPRGTTTAVVCGQGPRFPLFAGHDAAGKTTGFAVVGTGTGKGPGGSLVVHYLYGFTPSGQLSYTVRPLPVNQLDLAAGDMINAQRDALNAALRDAQEQVRNVLYENTSEK